MGKQVSYSKILSSLRERKKFERESVKKFIEQKCSICGNNLVNNGVSQYNSICRNCVSSSLKNI